MAHPRNTEVILKETIHGLGDLGQVVRVRAGYARNYLFPRAMAFSASEESKALIEHEQRLIKSKIKKLMSDAQRVAAELKGVVAEIHKKAGREGRLFGSVTNSDIEMAVQAKGFGVHRKQILLEGPIKQVGEYDIAIKLHPELKVNIKVKVIAEEDEDAAPPPKAEKAKRPRKAAAAEEEAPAPTEETPPAE